MKFSVSNAFDRSITIAPTLLPLLNIHQSFLEGHVECYSFYRSLLDISKVKAPYNN